MFIIMNMKTRKNPILPSLLAIEKGEPGVSFGAYSSVLMGLGLEKELSKIAADDDLGRKLQDAKLSRTRR